MFGDNILRLHQLCIKIPKIKIRKGAPKFAVTSDMSIY